MRLIKTLILSILLNFFTLSISNSEVVKQIEIKGNDRISDEIIMMFSEINVGQNIKTSKINEIIKNLYDSNFFKKVSVKFENNLILINVDEAPLIENITISGIKAKKNKELIRENFTLKERSSFNEFQLSQDVKNIESKLKSMGYYFAKIDPYVETLDNNMVNIE